MNNLETLLNVCMTRLHDTMSSMDGLWSESKDDRSLCGYLTKLNEGGLIKGSKTRWFALDKNLCTLHYYRSPKDTNGSPLGSIPIYNSAFTCTAEGLLVNSIQITNGVQTHILQAYDQKAMLWWLQELQAARRRYNVSQKQCGTGRVISDKIQTARISAKSESAGEFLLSPSLEESLEEVNYGDNLAIVPVLPRVEEPPETVGIKSADLDVLKTTSAGAFSELGSKVTQLGEGITKLSSKPRRPAPPTPTGIFDTKQTSTVPKRYSILDPTPQSKSEGKKLKSLLSQTNARFTHLLDSVQNAVKNGSTLGSDTGSKFLLDDSSNPDRITENLTLLQEEMSLMKASLDSKQETIELLKKELTGFSVLNVGSASVELFEDCPMPSVVHQMRSEITTLKLTIEHLHQEVNDTKFRLEQQEEMNKLLREMLVVKDEVVIKLTNELHDLQNHGKPSSAADAKNDTESMKALPTYNAVEEQNECGRSSTSKTLLDEVEGYKFQNKLLNNEILELAHLRKVDQGKIVYWHEQKLHQEALRCRLQSKYFVLLSEMDKVRRDTHFYTDIDDPLLHHDGVPSKPSVVQILIREAIQESELTEQEVSSLPRPPQYDKYGFSQIVDDGDESTLLNAASRLQLAAANILSLTEQTDTFSASKWQRYYSESNWQRNAEFKSLVRMGIPHELRHEVWKYLVQVRTLEIRDQVNSDGMYYKSLSDASVAPLYSKQIDLDLLRTLPNNRFFAKIDSAGIQRLKRVLEAYSLHNPRIGYCQGLNRIVAVALLYLCEEDAFWCLVATVECIMPGEYYTSTLTASQADQRVFRDLLAEKMPRIHKHLDLMGIDVSLITFNWFLCVFCDGVPPATMLNIWDAFLNEGSKVLFRYALAFFKHIEEDILELNDYMTLFNLLRKMAYHMHDTRSLTQMAFQGMNPLPMRKVSRLRSLHTEKVQDELRQLDLARSEFASRHPNVFHGDMDSDEEAAE